MPADPTAGRPASGKIYGLRSFLDPGCPADFAGAFRDNVRRLLRECGEPEYSGVEGSPAWRTLLADELTAAVVPLLAVEESVWSSPSPFCDYCRCSGWSHHFVSHRRYHFIIPAEEHWEKPLQSDAFHLSTHLLHGLVHCNGFGHLVCINGLAARSSFLSGHVLMDLWDRLCAALRARAVTVEDAARKWSMDLRLLHGVAYGRPWFARWGYRFHMGSFGVTEEDYVGALRLLSSLRLDDLLADLATASRDRELYRVINLYRSLRRPRVDPPLLTARDLLRFILDSKHRPRPVTVTPPQPVPAAKKARREEEPREPYRGFDEVVAEMSSRWAARRLRAAAEVVVGVLRERGAMMTRQEVRDAARVSIGDTGLLDFVLKFLGDCLVSGQVVRRRSNPANRVLEFTLEDPPGTAPSSPLSSSEAEVEESFAVPAWPRVAQMQKDTESVYRSLLTARPVETGIVLDAKHWVKEWGLGDDDDDKLRFLVMWAPTAAEMETLTRALTPPEVVVVEATATVGELKSEAERALRDTYCVLEGFRVSVLEGVAGAERDPVMVGGAESGARIWVSGHGADVAGCELRYEGGSDTWAVGCVCGARDDDGERMVACDLCDLWHHTRCVGIADGDDVPPLFLCAGCGGALLTADDMVA